MKQQWVERPEGGGVLALKVIRTFALLCGRSAARLVLCPITLYFLMRRGPERRASREYLRRVTGRKVSLWQVTKHIHCFASVTLDRVFLLSESFKRFDIRTHGREEVRSAWQQGRGVLIFGAHLGSFDVLRVFSQLNEQIKVKVVIDLEQGPAMTAIMNALNPTLAAAIINARQEGTATALAIKEALDEGALVTLLVDRARPGNAVTSANFLGEPAPFPTSPWLLAAALKVPVMLCFGLYRGGNRYDLHFEAFADTVTIERQRRETDLSEIAQRFADRLAHNARRAPYNWFNFYDFWHLQASKIGKDSATPVSGNDPSATGDIDSHHGDASRNATPGA